MVLNKLILSGSKARFNDLDGFSRNPTPYQNKILKELLEVGNETAYFHEKANKTVSNYNSFAKSIPVTDYNGLRPYIDRMRAGEENVLWENKVRWFAKSSGTTSDKSKYIPVSKTCLEGCHYQGSKDLVLFYLRNNPGSRLSKGKSLTLGGSLQTDELSDNSKYGDLSAILIENSPWYAELVRSPMKKNALIPNFEEKVAAISKEVIEQDIVSFAGVPSWNLVLMKQILDYSGKNNLLELWPNLEAFFHGGVSFIPYIEQFKRIIPSGAMNYMESYNASEGFFALQDDPKDSGMLILSDNGIFYEFIPLADYDSENHFPHACTLDEVKTGVNYVMVISTNAGLWRYVPGDTVMFTSTSPHRIKITGRTAHFINVFGEELIASNADHALKIVYEKCSARVTEYTVAPIFMDSSAKGAHEWVVEFDVEPDDLEKFNDLLDSAICSVNSDYEAKRANNTTLRRLKLTVVPKGTFYAWMASRNKLGGQNKIPRLYNTREYAEQLIKIAKKCGNFVSK